MSGGGLPYIPGVPDDSYDQYLLEAFRNFRLGNPVDLDEFFSSPEQEEMLHAMLMEAPNWLSALILKAKDTRSELLAGQVGPVKDFVWSVVDNMEERKEMHTLIRLIILHLVPVQPQLLELLRANVLKTEYFPNLLRLFALVVQVQLIFRLRDHKALRVDIIHALECALESSRTMQNEDYEFQYESTFEDFSDAGIAQELRFHVESYDWIFKRLPPEAAASILGELRDKHISSDNWKSTVHFVLMCCSAMKSFRNGVHKGAMRYIVGMLGDLLASENRSVKSAIVYTLTTLLAKYIYFMDPPDAAQIVSMARDLFRFNLEKDEGSLEMMDMVLGVQEYVLLGPKIAVFNDLKQLIGPYRDLRNGYKRLYIIHQADNSNSVPVSLVVETIRFVLSDLSRLAHSGASDTLEKPLFFDITQIEPKNMISFIDFIFDLLSKLTRRLPLEDAKFLYKCIFADSVSASTVEVERKTVGNEVFSSLLADDIIKRFHLTAILTDDKPLFLQSVLKLYAKLLKYPGLLTNEDCDMLFVVLLKLILEGDKLGLRKFKFVTYLDFLLTLKNKDGRYTAEARKFLLFNMRLRKHTVSQILDEFDLDEPNIDLRVGGLAQGISGDEVIPYGDYDPYSPDERIHRKGEQGASTTDQSTNGTRVQKLKRRSVSSISSPFVTTLQSEIVFKLALVFASKDIIDPKFYRKYLHPKILAFIHSDFFVSNTVYFSPAILYYISFIQMKAGIDVKEYIKVLKDVSASMDPILYINDFAKSDLSGQIEDMHTFALSTVDDLTKLGPSYDVSVVKNIAEYIPNLGITVEASTNRVVSLIFLHLLEENKKYYTAFMDNWGNQILKDHKDCKMDMLLKMLILQEMVPAYKLTQKTSALLHSFYNDVIQIDDRLLLIYGYEPEELRFVLKGLQLSIWPETVQRSDVELYCSMMAKQCNPKSFNSIWHLYFNAEYSPGIPLIAYYDYLFANSLETSISSVPIVSYKLALELLINTAYYLINNRFYSFILNILFRNKLSRSLFRRVFMELDLEYRTKFIVVLIQFSSSTIFQSTSEESDEETEEAKNQDNEVGTRTVLVCKSLELCGGIGFNYEIIFSRHELLDIIKCLLREDKNCYAYLKRYYYDNINTLLEIPVE